MSMRNPLLSLIFAALLAAVTPSPSAADTALPTRAEDASPVPVGSAAPDAALRSLDGETVSLSSFYGEGPLALIFYRGGW